MPRELSAGFMTEKSKAQNTPVFLYVLEQYDGQNDLRLTAWDTDIVFDALTYSRFPISHEFIGENNQGQIDQVKVRLANVSRLIQSYLESYDLRGKALRIRMVWLERLTDPQAKMDDVFYIDSYSADQNDVEFTLTGKFDVLGVDLPARRYARNSCAWKFKFVQCAYQGGESLCDKTRQRCKELGNYARFGAFPSVPTRRVYVM